MATDKNITGFMGILAASYPNFSLSRETITVYQRTLADLDDKVLENVVLHLIATSKWFPAISEIRKSAFMLQNNIPDEATAFDEARKAKPISYGDVEEVIEDGKKKYRFSETLYKWSHPLVEATALRMGWPDDFPTDNIVADRAHWNKYYEVLMNHMIEDGVTLPQVKVFAEQRRNELTEGIKKLADKMKMEE